MDESIELIDRAKHLHETAPPPFPLGSLYSRLCSMGVTRGMLDKMGKAFRDADMEDDATKYVSDAWSQTRYLVDVSLRSGVSVENIPDDVADAYLESIRRRAQYVARGAIRNLSLERLGGAVLSPRYAPGYRSVAAGRKTHRFVYFGLVPAALCGSYRWNTGRAFSTVDVTNAGVDCADCLEFEAALLDKNTLATLSNFRFICGRFEAIHARMERKSSPNAAIDDDLDRDIVRLCAIVDVESAIIKV